ncbi:hypothetical protein B5S33_g5423 [[Candida] boidinii]|nr:hypothetical protein B5S33_g5423 [[Candida] boidinii]
MSLNIVSNNGLPPDDPAVLIKESQNYEFSTSVPLNIWLNASSRMIKHGHSFASQGLIGDAYVLYSKFIDLFVKKLSKHPDLNVYKNNFKRSGILTKEGKSYKQYLELRKNLPPLMEECEKFKKILNDNYNSYLKLTNDQQNEYTNNGSSINKLISNRDKRYSNSSAISSNSSIGGSVTSGGKRRTSVVRGSFSDNSYLKLTNDQQNEYTNNGSSINKLISNRDKRYSNSSAISSNSSIGGSVTSGGKRRTSVVRGSFSDNSYLKLTNDQQNEYTNNGSSINKLISNRDKRYSNSSAISSNSSIGGSVTSGGKRRTSVVRGSFSDNSSGANKYSSSNSNYVNDIKLLKQIRSLSMNSDGGYNNGSAISNIDEFPSYPDTFNLSSLQSSLSDLSTLTSSNNIKPPALPEKVSLSSTSSASTPGLPPPPYTQHNDIVHKTVNFTEGGIPLKTVFIPKNIKDDFLKIAKSNTKKKLETCGVLCGKLSRNAFFITDLIIPEQDSTANTCNTKNEEKMFDVVDKLDLFVLGWIHTHPTQSCFLSSIDLHTQNSYQIMLNEAVALVCSPSPQFENHNFGCFRLTDPPGKPLITSCSLRGFHPHEEKNLYVTCNRLNGENSTGHVVFHDGLPFKIHDLR